MQQFLEIEFLGNNGENYLVAVVVFVGALIVFKIFQFVIIKKLIKSSQKTKTDVDDFLVSLMRKVRPPFYFLLAVYIALRFLTIKEFVSLMLDRLILIVVALQIILMLQEVIDYVTDKFIYQSIKNDETGKERIAEEAMIKMISKILKFILWATVALMVFSNMGVNVTSAIAGLGIGGIAIAMAAKDVLSDIIAAVSIYIDKPFRVGQKIQLGTDVGTVERIGIRTTRLKTPQGEQLVVSNRDMSRTRIQNFKKMKERRVKMNLGIVYGLSSEKLRKIPKLIEDIIKTVENAKFGRAHFANYGDFSLNFEVIYYVTSADYDIYAQAQQEINLAIYEKFEQEGIDFAFPTQEIILKR